MRRCKTGDLILIDFRTPEEWAETGVAQGALALTMHSRDFGAKVDGAVCGATERKFRAHLRNRRADKLYYVGS